MRYISSFLVIFLFLFISSSFAQSQIIYGAATGNSGSGGGNAPSSLYIINPNNGAGSLIGPIGFNGVTGLEILPDGRLVASANMDEGGGGKEGIAVAVLIEINRTTGAGTLIGVLGRGDVQGECGRMPDISYDTNTGTLFGYSDSCNSGGDFETLDARLIDYEGLYIINPNNANVSFVGPSGFEDGGNGMAVRPTDGKIFHTPNDANGGLVMLNRNTGQGTIIPGTEGNVLQRIGALDFNPATNVLYGALKPERKGPGGPIDAGLNQTEFDSLVIINQTNGITTIVGSSVPGLDAIVFVDSVSQVPTLSEYALIATALLLLAGSVLVLRRRQKLSV